MPCQCSHVFVVALRRLGTQVLTIKNSDIAKHLSLPPVKLHCSMLAEDAIKAAVRDIKVCKFLVCKSVLCGLG